MRSEELLHASVGGRLGFGIFKVKAESEAVVRASAGLRLDFELSEIGGKSKGMLHALAGGRLDLRLSMLGGPARESLYQQRVIGKGPPNVQMAFVTPECFWGMMYPFCQRVT
eukprot:361794-Chlamydomonas_euryale.AAC.6